jgi:RHS repeat-associated protein
LRFPGQYYDAETGLHYNWYRYYDSGIGRYITADPLRFKGGDLNLYNYVKASPINKFDKDGRKYDPKPTPLPSCSASDVSKIEIAIAEIEKVYRTCMTCDFVKPFKQELRLVMIDCSSSNRIPGLGIVGDGYANRKNRPHTIVLTPDGLDPNKSAGCLEALIMHEMMHLISDDVRDAPTEERNCFKCSSFNGGIR